MNIYQIKQEMLELIEQIEENDGEITEELQEAIAITEDKFKSKVHEYINVIKILDTDIDSIKQEQKRLKELSEKKDKTIAKLKSIIIDAIEEFGDTKKSGVKYVDYGLGEVSVRQSKAVEVNKDNISEIGNSVKTAIYDAKSENQLRANDHLDSSLLLSLIKDNNSDTNITDEDLQHTNIEISTRIPLSSLIDGSSFSIIREIAEYTSDFNVSAEVSKSNIKRELEDNGACAPNIAKLVINKNIKYV